MQSERVSLTFSKLKEAIDHPVSLKRSSDEVEELREEKRAKQRNYSKRSYDKKKDERKRCYVPQYLELLDSLVQDNDQLQTRSGSTLVTFNKSTFLNIGKKIMEILGKTSLASLKLLDLGCGHCHGLADLAYRFNTNNVGLEVDDETMFGAVIKKYRCMRSSQKDELKIPFVSIKGDITELENLGSARVIYAWIRGAGPKVYDKIFELFLKDLTAEIFVMDTVYELPPGVVIADTISGKSTRCGFLLYFYRKTNFNHKNRNRKFKKNNGLSGDIFHSFMENGKFNQMKKIEKEKKAEEGKTFLGMY